MIPTIEFWFDFASTYSYLSASRVQKLSEEHKVQIQWKPFLLGPIFNEQGWNNSPFVLYPAKGRYMWMDMARCARKENLPFQVPSVFPRNGLLPARIAVAAENESWLPEFVRSVFGAEFGSDRDIGEPAVIADVLTNLGLNAEEWVSKASLEGTKDTLRRNTERAKEMGIFGAPTFVINGELFWGNDRLEDALLACR